MGEPEIHDNSVDIRSLAPINADIHGSVLGKKDRKEKTLKKLRAHLLRGAIRRT